MFENLNSFSYYSRFCFSMYFWFNLIFTEIAISLQWNSQYLTPSIFFYFFIKFSAGAKTFHLGVVSSRFGWMFQTITQFIRLKRTDTKAINSNYTYTGKCDEIKSNFVFVCAKAQVSFRPFYSRRKSYRVVQNYFCTAVGSIFGKEI